MKRLSKVVNLLEIENFVASTAKRDRNPGKLRLHARYHCLVRAVNTSLNWTLD